MKKLLYLLLLSAGLSQAQIPQLAPLTVGGLKIRGGYRLNDSSVVVVAYDSAKQHITTTKRINLCSDTTKASYLGDIYRDGDTLIFTPSTGPYNRLYMVGATQGQILAFDTLCECWKPTDISSIAPSGPVFDWKVAGGTRDTAHLVVKDSTATGIHVLQRGPDTLVIYSTINGVTHAGFYQKRSGGTNDSVAVIFKDSTGISTVARGDTIIIYSTVNGIGHAGFFWKKITQDSTGLVIKDSTGVTTYQRGDTLVILNSLTTQRVQSGYIQEDGSGNISSKPVQENTTPLGDIDWSRTATGTFISNWGQTDVPRAKWVNFDSPDIYLGSSSSYFHITYGFTGFPNYQAEINTYKVDLVANTITLVDIGANIKIPWHLIWYPTP